MRIRRIEEFELSDTLGVGTVGTIYRARDLANGCEVAVKILLPTVSNDELIKARFGREMLILEQLSHPNIVRYYGGGRIESQLFYAMELVDGGTLKDVLEQSGRLSWAEAATCGVQICSALQHAHNHGIIHRDLKPSNLFLTADGDLKLGDFGIARDTKASDITADRLTVGTYAYMSPEQIAGDREISGKTDLYALGCLIFEMLTGRPPFEGASFAQLFDQHLRVTAPRVREIEAGCPPELDDLVSRLLDKSPDARPFNARTVQAKLMQLLDRTPVGATADDVCAADALGLGKVTLSKRLSQVKELRQSREISWLSLACVVLAAIGIVCAAWCFGI
jgi:serine/threonine protein kinase